PSRRVQGTASRRRAEARDRADMSAEERAGERARFLNVDLDIEAAQDLSLLVHALGPSAFDLHTGPVGAGFETHLELASDAIDPDTAIKRFVELLDALPPRAKRLWNTATRKDFSIGIQGGTEPRVVELAVRPETLKAVARLGARVVVTVY